MFTCRQDDKQGHTSRSLSQQFLYLDEINIAHGIMGNNIQQVFFASECVCGPANEIDTTALFAETADRKCEYTESTENQKRTVKK